MIRLPPRSTRTDTLFPYTPLFRSHREIERSCRLEREPVLPRGGRREQGQRQRQKAAQSPLHLIPLRPRISIRLPCVDAEAVGMIARDPVPAILARKFGRVDRKSVV